jgi:hypothetical protein
MSQPNDLSRSLVTLDQNSTIIAVVELSHSSQVAISVKPRGAGSVAGPTLYKISIVKRLHTPRVWVREAASSGGDGGRPLADG